MPPPATTSGQAQTNLQNYTGGMQSPTDAMNAANNQFGVQQQQATVQGLRGSLQATNQLLQNVAPSVMGRTANSLVTSAQANRQVANESAPIQTNLNNLGTQEQNATQDYNAAVGQAQHLADSNLTAQGQHQSYLQGIYNDLYTQEQNAAQIAAEKYVADASVKAAGASVASPSLGMGGVSGSGAAGPVGASSRNSVGGYSFTGANGQPTTMAAYLVANGATPANIMSQVAGILNSSKVSMDHGIANAVSGGHYTPAQLEKLYPQIFGGM